MSKTEIVDSDGISKAELYINNKLSEAQYTLDGDVWIEGRMCSFKVKDGMHDTFEKLFKEYFGTEFILKSKKEILDEKLFGTGEEHELFRDSLGDYFGLAISDKFFKYSVNSVDLRSMHAGFTEDEMRIPLIVNVK